MAKLPDRFCITITGRTDKALSRENIKPWVGNLLAALLTGQEVDLDSFRSWGIKVEVDQTPWE